MKKGSDLLIRLLTVLLISAVTLGSISYCSYLLHVKNANSPYNQDIEVSTRDHSSQTDNATPQSYLNAESILHNLQNRYPSITQIDAYTEENDPDRLLGKEHQYIGKVDFYDMELINASAYLSNHTSTGTLEVFQNQADMESRKTYIQAIYDNAPNLQEYIFAYDTVLLRLNNQYSLAEAREYANAITAITNQAYTTQNREDLRHLMGNSINENKQDHTDE